MLGDLLKKWLPLLTFAPMWFFGEKDETNKYIQEIWVQLKQASPPVSMVLFYLWMRESTERREAQKQCHERTVDFINSANLATSAFRALEARLKRRSRRRG